MQEVLFPIGTIVEITNNNENIVKYLIIGVRQYSPHSGKAWDYIAIPYPEGYCMNCKSTNPYDDNNLYFFNHTDIENIINIENSK